MELNATVDYLKELLLPLSDRIMTAFVLILIGLIVGRIAAKLLSRVLEEINMNETLQQITGWRIAFAELTTLLTRYFIYLIFVILALNTLQLTTFIIEILATIALFGLFISFLLALKDFIPTFVAGWKLQKGGLLKEGDTVQVADIKGRVQKCKLQDTLIRTKEGDLISLPNAYLLRHPLKRKKR